MPGTSPSGLNQTERKDAVDHGSEGEALLVPFVVLVVVVRLCVRDATIYPING
jgi:hypothetical protein